MISSILLRIVDPVSPKVVDLGIPEAVSPESSEVASISLNRLLLGSGSDLQEGLFVDTHCEWKFRRTNIASLIASIRSFKLVISSFLTICLIDRTMLWMSLSNFLFPRSFGTDPRSWGGQLSA